MVERYPHTATITVTSGGEVVNGEWVPGTATTTELIGRYDPVEKKGENIRYNPNGDEILTKGEFYTQHRAIKGAEKITIPAKGIVARKILFWEEYQTHTIIIV